MADLPKAAPSAANPRVLAVYGVPPDMPLQDAAAKSIGKTFSLTTVNRASFESALKQGLSGFVGGDAPLAGARFVFIRGLPDLSAAGRSGEWTHVIYYGHAAERENALIPGPGQRISATQLAGLFRGSAVTHVDILGCRSLSIAAELSAMLPTLRVGGLAAKRQDNIEVDPRTLHVIKFEMSRQPIRHFGPQN
jgi:hypothetical protein